MAEQKQMWGAAEYAARLADLELVRAGTISLDEAKARASARRQNVGLSMSAAASAVSDHCREVRREEARAAIRRATGAEG